MPRPNHDVPSLLLGGIKDVADSVEKTNEDAHIMLLELALVVVGILDESRLDNMPDSIRARLIELGAKLADQEENSDP